MAEIIVGFQVTPDDFLTLEKQPGTALRCPQGHAPKKQAHRFCTQCGGEMKDDSWYKPIAKPPLAGLATLWSVFGDFATGQFTDPDHLANVWNDLVSHAGRKTRQGAPITIVLHDPGDDHPADWLYVIGLMFNEPEGTSVTALRDAVNFVAPFRDKLGPVLSDRPIRVYALEE